MPRSRKSRHEHMPRFHHLYISTSYCYHDYHDHHLSLTMIRWVSPNYANLIGALSILASHSYELSRLLTGKFSTMHPPRSWRPNTGIYPDGVFETQSRTLASLISPRYVGVVIQQVRTYRRFKGLTMVFLFLVVNYGLTTLPSK